MKFSWSIVSHGPEPSQAPHPACWTYGSRDTSSAQGTSTCLAALMPWLHPNGMTGDRADTAKGSPVGPPGFRSPVPLGMWGQSASASLLWDTDANRHPVSGALACPVMALIPDLPSAIGAA